MSEISLHNKTVGYPQSGSAHIFDTVIVKKIAALSDVDDSTTPMDLFLGATGAIKINVGSNEAIKIGTKSAIDATTIIEGINGMPIQLKSDANYGKVILGGFETTTIEVNETDYIKTTSSYMSIETSNMTVTGSANIEGDILSNASITGNKLNVVRTFENEGQADTDIGYGFSIADDESLVMYKYSSDTDTVRTVNIFGKGSVAATAKTDHLNHDFPIFQRNNGASVSTTARNLLRVTGVTDSVSLIGGGGLWNSNVGDNNIHYTSGDVGINTTNPQYPLDVNGNAIIRGTLRATQFSVGTNQVHIVGSNINNVTNINNDFVVPQININSDVKINDGKKLFAKNTEINGTLSVSGNTIFGDISANTMTLNTLNAQQINLENTDIKNLFVTDGFQVDNVVIDNNEINNLENINSSNLSVAESINIGDGIYITSTDISGGNISTTGTLKVNHIDTTDNFILVKSNLIPETSTINLGSESQPFGEIHANEGYFSANTVYIGGVGGISFSKDVDEQGNPKLMISGGILESTEGISTGNGGNIHAMEDPLLKETGSVMVVRNGEYKVANIMPRYSYGDFDSVTGPEGTTGVTQSITASYRSSTGYDWTHDDGWKWSVKSNTTTVLPPAVDGTAVDMTEMTELITGNNLQNIHIHCIQEDNSYISEATYFIPTPSSDIKDVINVNTYIPSSKYFLTKFKSSYDTYFNSRLQNLNLKMENVTVHSARGKIFAMMPDNSTNKAHLPGTSEFLMMFLGTYDAPIYNTEIISTTNSTYLVPTNTGGNSDSIARRKTLAHEWNGLSFSNVTDPEGSILFPFISFTSWVNKTDEYKFTQPIYKNIIGWGDTPNISDVYSNSYLTSEGWLFELYIRTFLYIKYGNPYATVENDTDWDNIYLRYTAYVRDVVGHNIRLHTKTVAGVSTVYKISLKQSAFSYITDP